MGRPSGTTRDETLQKIRVSATRRIYELGFEAVTMRQVASDVGIKAASLYNHFASKQDLLYSLLSDTMTDLEREMEKALLGAEDPLEALRNFVTFHIAFHTKRKEEVFIGNMELRSLRGGNYTKIVARRAAYEKHLQSILENGNRGGHWQVEEPKVATYTLIAMLTGICNWYTPSGRLPMEELTRLYLDQILNGLNTKGRE